MVPLGIIKMKLFKKYRKAVFIVAYSIDKKGQVQYIILKRKLHWKGWEFPKGKIELFESKRKTAIRELKEETGLEIVPGTFKNSKVRGKYLYDRVLKDRPEYKGQTYYLFSVQVKKAKAKLDKKEHSSSKWVSYKTALKNLTWPNQRRCLRIVNKMLMKRHK
jgi:8-oxo-dGTP pyrophosphatase MutT (NUDIX family)